MGRRLAWLSTLTLAVLACQEELTAPGACPDFCPSTLITVVDTVIERAVVRDSAFRGYVQPHRSRLVQVVNEASGPTSRAVMKFLPFTEGFSSVVGDTSDIVALDSFRLRLILDDRPEVASLELRLHRLPVSVDTLVSLPGVEPFLDDSTLITAFAVPDTVAAEDTLRIAFGPEGLPSFDADERVVVMAIELRSASPSFLAWGALGSGSSARLTRFLQVDSAGVAVERSDERSLSFDTFVFPPPPDLAEPELNAGGAPSSRSILRVELPASIIDSSNLVRVTLILVPSVPALGAPGDTFTLQTEPLTADFGPKSPIIPTLVPGLGSAEIPVGSADTVRIDVTHIARLWRLNLSVPRSFMLRVTPEASGLAEFRFNSSRSPTGTPSLQVTYVPLIQP